MADMRALPIRFLSMLGISEDELAEYAIRLNGSSSLGLT